MQPLPFLKSILNERYTDEDGEPYQIKLKPGLSEAQIAQVEDKLPGKLPAEIRSLLEFTSGFELGYYELDFTHNGEGFEELIKHWVTLTGDGTGNFWLLEVSETGQWGQVYFACHDPAVLVKHSDSLTQFLEHLHEYCKKTEHSHWAKMDDLVYRIGKHENLLDVWDALAPNDGALQAFAQSFDDIHLIADLRGKPLGSGFERGQFMSGNDGAIFKHPSLELWALRKPKPSAVSRFFKKLFG